jgi:hypothetical protein
MSFASAKVMRPAGAISGNFGRANSAGGPKGRDEVSGSATFRGAFDRSARAGGSLVIQDSSGVSEDCSMAASSSEDRSPTISGPITEAVAA